MSVTLISHSFFVSFISLYLQPLPPPAAPPLDYRAEIQSRWELTTDHRRAEGDNQKWPGLIISVCVSWLRWPVRVDVHGGARSCSWADGAADSLNLCTELWSCGHFPGFCFPLSHSQFFVTFYQFLSVLVSRLSWTISADCAIQLS